MTNWGIANALLTLQYLPHGRILGTSWVTAKSNSILFETTHNLGEKLETIVDRDGNSKPFVIDVILSITDSR